MPYRRRAPRVPVVAVLVVLALHAWGAFVLTRPADALMDSALRVITAGALVFVIPGLAWGEALRIRTVHPLDGLARASALSLAVGLGLAVIVFALGLTIQWWAALLIAVGAVGTLIAGGRAATRSGGGLATDLVRGLRRDPIAMAAYAAAISVMAVGLYRLADSPAAVGWEVGLQLGYVRQYASGLRLDPRWCALRPDASLQLPNVFFLWEFLLAGVSRLAGIDPLIAALRSRWLIPALGLPAFFSMMLHVFRSRAVATGAFAVVLLLVFSGFMFLPPSPLVMVGAADASRGLTGFAGSVHHSDTGMEVLLPLQVAALFQFLGSGKRTHLLALLAMLAVGFFWHPREYFQVMWYGGVAGAALLALGRRRWSRPRLGRRTAILAASFLVLAIALSAAASSFGPRGPLASGEMEIKRSLLGALTSRRVLLGSYAPFDAPYMGYGSPLPNQPYLYSWMALAALALVPLALLGSRQLRFVSVFYVLLWFVTICWFWSQVLLVVLSYSEILVASMRFLHLFAMAVIGAGWVVAIGALREAGRRRIADPSIALVATLAAGMLGVAFAMAWRLSRPEFRIMGPTLSVIALLAAVMAVCRGWPRDTAPRRLPSTALAAGTFLAFVAPSWVSSPGGLVPRLHVRPSAPVDLFSRSPTGLSARMIRFLREQMPPREIVLVDPLGTHLLGIYAPVYVRPYPVGYVIPDLLEIQSAREGHHPLFHPPSGDPPAAVDAAVDYVAGSGARWILASPPHAMAMEALASARPARFEVVLRTGAGEVLLHVTGRP